MTKSERARLDLEVSRLYRILEMEPDPLFRGIVALLISKLEKIPDSPVAPTHENYEAIRTAVQECSKELDRLKCVGTVEAGVAQTESTIRELATDTPTSTAQAVAEQQLNLPVPGTNPGSRFDGTSTQNNRWHGCPCLHTIPCSTACTCRHPSLSAGCSRCCTYGSPEQQRAKAEQLVSLEHNFQLIGPGILNPDVEKIKEVQALLDAHASRVPTRGITGRTLSLWQSSEPSWVVARTPFDARNIWCHYVGERTEDYSASDWKRCDPGSSAKYWIHKITGKISPHDDPEAELVELTAAEVVTQFGRGYIASASW